MKNGGFMTRGLLKWVVLSLIIVPRWGVAAPYQEERVGKANPQYAKTKNILRTISVYGMYNMADKMSLEGSVNNANLSGESTGSNSFGLGAEIKFKQLESGFYVKGGVGYEFGRTFSKTSGRIANAKFNKSLEAPKPELTAWVLSLNGELPISEEMSLFGGGNYNFPTFKNQTGSYSGKIGWQVGMSYLISENLMLDGMWRSLNITGTDDNVSYDNENIAGFVIRGRIAFE